MLMPRDRAAALGQETLRILEAGGYEAPSGHWVDLTEATAASVGGTVSYPPEAPGNAPPCAGLAGTVTVENATTLEVGRRLEEGGPVLALNFASATNPGGGFLSGARAQEESLARSSGLHRCLTGNPMYTYHRQLRDPAYTDYALYSPAVPVFRTDDGDLLEEPWPLSILTCAAVSARELAKIAPERLPQTRAIMFERARKVLAIGRKHRHQRIVLGAWGCGAFGIDSALMAEVFAELLSGPFAGAFETIVFAITDWSPEQRFIGPFRKRFEGAEQRAS